MVKLIHVIQHLRRKVRVVSFLWVHRYLRLQIISMSSCNCAWSRLLHRPRPLRLLPIILLIHSPIVHIIPILNRQPRILPYLLTILPRFQVNNIILTCLLIIYPTLVKIKGAFPIVRQFGWKILPLIILNHWHLIPSI